MTRDSVPPARRAIVPAVAGVALLVGGMLVLLRWHGSAPADVWRLAMALLLSPLLEELVFRAGIQAELQGRWRGRHGANIATSLLFAALHAGIGGSTRGLAVLAPSLLLGECYRRTGRLLPCWLAHAAMNACWMFWLQDVVRDLQPLFPIPSIG